MWHLFFFVINENTAPLEKNKNSLLGVELVQTEREVVPRVPRAGPLRAGQRGGGGVPDGDVARHPVAQPGHVQLERVGVVALASGGGEKNTIYSEGNRRMMGKRCSHLKNVNLFFSCR